MRIDIITVLPELLSGPLNHSIIKRAREKGVVDIHIHDLRDFSTDKHRKVDDYAFGGDAGMVMTIEPIERAITTLQSERKYDEVIYTSPDGKLFSQPEANRMATLENIIILCGHYKGIDQRVRDHLITCEISIGDYVLSGGELGALVVMDAVSRLIPGVLGGERSNLEDSFEDGLLEYPHYTRPRVFQGKEVPPVLISGDHEKIRLWRRKESLKRTLERRPDLIQKARLTSEDERLLDELKKG